MITRVEIPKNKQILALAEGLSSVYELVEHYTGRPINFDIRIFITVTKEELISFLTNHLEYAYRHIKTNEQAEKMHDLPVLLSKNEHWIVCWMDHGMRRYVTIYHDLAEATANYLMAYWGGVSKT